YKDKGGKTSLPQIGGGWRRDGAAGILARTPGVIDAPGIAGEIAAAMDRHELQFGEAGECAGQDQIMKGERSLERIAEHVVEIVMREAIPVREAVGMHHNKDPKLLGAGEEGAEFRI